MSTINAALYLSEPGMVAIGDLPLGGPDNITTLKKVDGVLESPEMRTNESAPAFVDGVVSGFTTLGKRIVVLSGEIASNNKEEYEAALRTFKAKTNPSRGTNTVQFAIWLDAVGDGLPVQMDARIVDRNLYGVTYRTLAGYTRWKLMLSIDSPFLQSAELNTLSILPQILGSDPGVTLPLTAPFSFGSPTVSQQTTINPAGSEEIQDWTIRIAAVGGDLVNPYVTNSSQGKTLDFAGFTLTDGKTLVLESSIGKKRVYEEGAGSRYHELTSYDWFTLVPNFNNLLEFGFDSDAGNATCEIQFRNTFL